MHSILEKYANLLVHYCLDIQPGEKLFINTTTLAEPLVREIYRSAIKAGGIVEYHLAFSEEQKIRLDNAEGDQLNHASVLKAEAMQNFDAYLFIKAPHNLVENQEIDKQKLRQEQAAFKPFSEIYSKRTANGQLKRSLCLYPTHASAQMAGMSLEDYSTFVFNACRLYDEDPKASWLAVRKEQQGIVDYLNKAANIRYVTNTGTDVSFNVKDRIWINSDGRTNMPSGEVFTGPVEDSVNGEIFFNYPSVYQGYTVQGITLTVKNGEVVKWKADEGQEVLDELFTVDGSRFFGEVAIGTNYNIKRATKNILFDEKIGGTVHMAVGNSYIQTGGKNKSVVHWDMITDMTQSGQIYADDVLIYENGKFLID